MSRVLLVLGWVACTSGSDTGKVVDTDTDTDSDTDTDTDADTDADTDSDTGTGVAAFTSLDWRLHDRIGSLVVVSWTQDRTAQIHVEYAVDEGVWRSTPTTTFEAGAHEQLIVGIPYAHDAEWRLVADDGTTVEGDPLTTGPLPSGMPIPTVTVSDPTRQLPGADYFLSSINERDGGWTGGKYWTFIIDRQGRILWAHAAPTGHWTLFATIARTGDHFLWDEATYWSDFDGGRGSKIHRTYLDTELEVIPTPGLHHAFVELPDQTLVWGSQAHGGGEALVEKAPGQVDETVLWTCEDDWPGVGECESNGIFYAESTDSFLYSFYTNNSIVEVDHGTGESLWWAGDVPDGYTFEPRISEYTWQHGISYTDAGTLLVSSEWDGGVGRPYHTWLMEYEVDPATGTLSLLWASDSGVLADTNGQAWRLSNGNTLHVVGSASVIREVDPAADEDVWRVEFQSDRLLGKGEFLTDLYALVAPVE